MKTTATLAMLAMAGTSALAEKRITVCMQRGSNSLTVVHQAQTIVSKIYAGIGVKIEWYRDSRSCPAEGIRISLDTNTNGAFHPGALAYARPYEGTHIRIFYDRLQTSVNPNGVPSRLAHIVAHEIGHLLQGIARHSDSGIMKAVWDADDFQQMAWNPLEFTKTDVELIHLGLASRESRLRASAR